MPSDLETKFDPVVAGPPGTSGSVASTTYEPYCVNLDTPAPAGSPGPCSLISKTSGGQYTWQDIANAEDLWGKNYMDQMYGDWGFEAESHINKIAASFKERFCPSVRNRQRFKLRSATEWGSAEGVPLSGVYDITTRTKPKEEKGTFKDVNAKCKSRINSRSTMAQTMISYGQQAFDFGYAQNNDYNPAVFPAFHLGGGQYAFKRTWCDIFCMADRQEKATNAIQLSLQKSMQETEQNMATLSEWLQKGTVGMGALLYEQADLFWALETLQLNEILKNTDPATKSLTQMQGGLRQMAEEIGDARSPDQKVGAAALRRFDATVASVGEMRKDRPNATQAKVMVGAYSELYTTLQHIAEGSRTRPGRQYHRQAAGLEDKLSFTKTALARRAHDLGKYSAALQLLGEHKRNSLQQSGWAAVQLELMDAAAASTLMELDKTFWQVRETVSDFTDTEAQEHVAFVNSLAAIQSYIGCQSDHKSLLKEYQAAEEVHFAARRKLQSTWTQVESHSGLLASLIVDGNVFSRLAAFDAQSINASVAQSVLTNIAKTKACTPELPGARAALKQLILQTVQHGFFGQTLEQSNIVFELASSVRMKFANAGLPVPEDNSLSEFKAKLTQAYSAAITELDVNTERLVQNLKAEIPACNERNVTGAGVSLAMQEVREAQAEALSARLEAKEAVEAVRAMTAEATGAAKQASEGVREILTRMKVDAHGQLSPEK